MKGNKAITSFLVCSWAQNNTAIKIISKGCSGRMPTNKAVTASQIPRHINKVRSSRVGGHLNFIVIVCFLFLVQSFTAMHDSSKSGEIGKNSNNRHCYNEDEHWVE